MSISSNSWWSLLLNIGEECPEDGGSDNHVEQINKCYDALLPQLRDPHEIIEGIVRCAKHLPHKIPYYGVLVGLLNMKDKDFGKKVVNLTRSRFQDSLNSADCNTIRVLLRFLTVLMCNHAVQPLSLVEIFNTLLSFAIATVDEVTGNPFWQSCADFYVICILSSLLWGSAELGQEVLHEWKELLTRLQKYIDLRGRSQYVGLSVFESEGETVESEDFLKGLLNDILALSVTEWTTGSVPRYHLLFDTHLVDGSSHALSAVKCPELSMYRMEKEKNEAILKYPHRLSRLHIFPCIGAAKMRTIDAFVVEEYLQDVLISFNGCKDSGEQYPMVSLPVGFRNEYLMAETIFSQLLLLPRPPLTPSYYTLVIAHLCEVLPTTFFKVVKEAVQILFDRIADMDMECRRRLILVFCHHLANVQYIWPWEEWGYVKDLPKWDPKRVFIQEVLERGVRLSCWERIKQSIKEAPELEELLPPNGGPNFNPSFENFREDKKAHARALTTEFCGMVWADDTVPQLIAWIDETIKGMDKSKIGMPGDEAAIEIIIPALLGISSMSFNHLKTVLRQYGGIITHVCSDHRSQVRLMDHVSFCWSNSTRMIVSTIKQMMEYKLISSVAIVDWVFSSSNINQFHLSDHPWEILRNTINEICKRSTGLRSEQQSLTKSVSLAKAAIIKAQMQAENSERLKQLKYKETSLKKSLEAMDALCAQASNESKALFCLLYEKFRDALNEKLPPVHTYTGEESFMKTDNENEESESQMNDERTGNNGYKNEGQKQWCRTTLGYVKAFTRQYATEIWLHMDVLNATVFHHVHHQFRKAVYIGLGKKI